MTKPEPCGAISEAWVRAFLKSICTGSILNTGTVMSEVRVGIYLNFVLKK